MRKKRISTIFNVIAGLASILLAWKYIALPEVAKLIYKEDYKQLMFQCDNVMRDHLIAKNRVIHKKTEESIDLLKSAEVGLLSCHEYDKLRKKMLVAGVSTDELSMIGLEAIEENVVDIKKYVEIHEFKF